MDIKYFPHFFFSLYPLLEFVAATPKINPKFSQAEANQQKKHSILEHRGWHWLLQCQSDELCPTDMHLLTQSSKHVSSTR